MIRAILCSVVAILTVAASAGAFQNEPTEFRGIKWGAEITQLSDMEFQVKSAGLDIYSRKNENLAFGSADLKAVAYSFYKDRFCAVFVAYEDWSNFNALMLALSEMYGSGKRDENNPLEHTWLGKNIFIILDYNELSAQGKIIYYYAPIWFERDKDMQ